jgi:GTP-binding protein Era
MRDLSRIKKPLVMVMNKMDKGQGASAEFIAAWQANTIENGNLRFFIPASGLVGTNIKELIEVTYSLLPEGPLYYPEDTVTDFPKNLSAADIVREKLFAFLKDEIPHSLTVVIDEMDERRNKLLYIKATVLVNTASQRQIVIGKKAQNLKEVGTLAREELQDLFKKRVFLEIFVKAENKWRNDPEILEKLRFFD